MKYSELTQEQRDIRQKVWSEVLDTFCPSYYETDEETGEQIEIGKPCDMGRMCDSCQYDYGLKVQYRDKLRDMGVQLVDEDDD